MADDEWTFVGLSLNAEMFGWDGVVDLSVSRWQSVDGDPVQVREPRTGKLYHAHVYKLPVNTHHAGGAVITFATVEMTPGVYGFWLPTKP
ncbi:MAG: hypothetical protein AAGF84_12610 [Planctomycetota bacterium]